MALRSPTYRTYRVATKRFLQTSLPTRHLRLEHLINRGYHTPQPFSLQSHFHSTTKCHQQDQKQLRRSPIRPSGPHHLPSHKAATAICIGLLSVFLASQSTNFLSFDSPASFADAGDDYGSASAVAEIPQFRISEIRKHDAKSERPWVIYRNKVYDITDWVPAHPGGEVILRAAGGAIDPYWDIFTIHKSQYVQDILSQFFIGHVHPSDLVNGLPPKDEIEDPFVDDPTRHPSLIVRTSRPCNAETPEETINNGFLTPNELFYVRNHMWVPKVAQEDADNHVLTVELIDGETKEYTLRELKSKFRTHKITACLQCSGNRRSHMSDASGRSTNGLQWKSGAISNASWEGVLLADILKDSGLSSDRLATEDENVKHVQFSGLEAYGASIPIKKAIDPQGDVLLAFKMNGEPLPRDHGFPLRAIVPGHVAARSVKWLNHITLSDEESTSQWQRRDYKCFGPNETKVDWDAAPSIQELPVQSAITNVRLGSWSGGDQSQKTQETNTTPGGTNSKAEPLQKVSVSGYAYSGGGHSIARVDVSLDGGQTWSQAYLLPDCSSKEGAPSLCHGHAAWTWKRWRFNGSIPLRAFTDCKEGRAKTDGESQPTESTKQLMAKPTTSKENNIAKIHETGKQDNTRCTTIVVKATDDAYNTQPESHAATWNFRGNLATAWHRVKVCSDCKAPREDGSSDRQQD